MPVGLRGTVCNRVKRESRVFFVLTTSSDCFVRHSLLEPGGRPQSHQRAQPVCAACDLLLRTIQRVVHVPARTHARRIPKYPVWAVFHHHSSCLGLALGLR